MPCPVCSGHLLFNGLGRGTREVPCPRCHVNWDVTVKRLYGHLEALGCIFVICAIFLVVGLLLHLAGVDGAAECVIMPAVVLFASPAVLIYGLMNPTGWSYRLDGLRHELEKRRLDPDLLAQELAYVRSRLPPSQGASPALYRPPDELARIANATDLSTEALQRASDHMAGFLGVAGRIKVTVGAESSDDMLATQSDLELPPHAGLFRVSRFGSPEVRAIKKRRFNLWNLMAVLAHEYTHAYLAVRGIVLATGPRNEILTELAAVCLGLGPVLAHGYSPIEWRERTPTLTNPFRRRTHRMLLGYIAPDTIVAATAAVALDFGWDRRELMAMLPRAYRRSAGAQIKERAARREQAARRDEAAGRLARKLDELRRLCDELPGLLARAAAGPNAAAARPALGRDLVDIANSVGTGQLALELGRAADRARKDGTMAAFDELAGRVEEWHRLLRKVCEAR